MCAQGVHNQTDYFYVIEVSGKYPTEAKHQSIVGRC